MDTLAQEAKGSGSASKEWASRFAEAPYRANVARLLEELAVARVDGRYSKVLASLAKVDALVIDDWAITPLTADGRRDLLEVLDDRHQRRSTLVTSQLAVEHWHDYLADPTIADAILDRLVHNSYRITLQGESLRKRGTPDLTDLTAPNP